MGSQSQAMPFARNHSTMLYRRARSALVLIAAYWLWLVFGGANFIGALFGSPVHAMLALYGVGVVTLISLLAAPVAIAYLLTNRPQKKARGRTGSKRTELASVIRLVPRRVADTKTALTHRAADAWRDLAS